MQAGDGQGYRGAGPDLCRDDPEGACFGLHNITITALLISATSENGLNTAFQGNYSLNAYFANT